MKNRYSAAECFRNYRFHSIFWKNLLLICCVVLLPFLCTLLISGYTYDELRRNETESYSNELMVRASMEVTDLFDEARDTCVRAAFDEDIRSFVQSLGTASFVSYDVNDIIKYLSTVKLTKEEISSILIYRVSDGTVLSNANKSHYNRYEDRRVLDAWDSLGDIVQIHYLPANRDLRMDEQIVFYFRPGYGRDRYNSCIIISYNPAQIAERLDYGADAKLTILQNGHILYDSEGVDEDSYTVDIQTLLETQENTIAMHKDLGENGLELILRVNSRPLYDKLEHIRIATVVLVVGSMLATVLVVFYISRKIFDPISDLLALLEENQTPEESNLIQTTDEIGYIRHMMSATITKSKDIEEELSRRMKLLKKAQAVALQAQINPHFMYNTIDTINWMAIKKIGKGNEVSEMLNMLSQLLRYSLGNTDTVVSLREEINYTKKYLLVQQIRCNYGFEVIWDIPEDLNQCNVIKMILQPVVENAIKYGIKPFGDGGVLQIRAVRTGETVRIFVSDSGFGMTQEEADEVNRVISSQVIKESDHIGLSNVHQRINLMFGDQYGVSVRSRINEGTTVELMIPYLQ